MKKLLIVAFIVTSFASCVKVNFNDDTDGGGGNDTTAIPTILAGRIDKDLSLPKSNYEIRGFVYVGKGATLTIAAGSVFKASTSEKSALIIEQGGKIIADGRADAPIIFTSGKPAGSRTPADWGGISICGYAPTNRPLSPPPVTEGGSNRPYGGTDPSDNSGVLRYVRIEWAGITAENNSELNGLTLYGVGAGTVIDYVQAVYCGDDGFEFFGGTVNAKHLVSYASGDDDFDFDFGYSGKIQYAVSLRDKYSDEDAANGIECDNDGTGTSATPNTRPTLSNFTLIGPYDTTGTSTNGSLHGQGNRWRRAARFVFRNSIMLGFKTGGFELSSNETINDYYTNNLSEFKNNLVHAYTSPFKLSSPNTTGITATQIEAKATADGCVKLVSRDDAKLTNPFSLNSPDFRPATGSPALGQDATKIYTGLDGFFTAGTYLGAFGSGANDNWLNGWTNFNPQTTSY